MAGPSLQPPSERPSILAQVIGWSIDHAGMVLMGAALLVALAGVTLSRMPVDVFPELNAPTVVILTESPGLIAEEVEQRVTFPIESAMTSLTGVRRVRSASAQGLSLVWVEFAWGEDIYRSRQLVAERLSGVKEALPEASHPEIGPISSITGEIMLLSLSSESAAADELQLRAYAEFDLRPRLLAIPGIAQVVAIGGALPEYRVAVRPEELLLSELSFADVVAAAAEAHSTEPGGYLPNVDGQERPLQQLAQVESAADVAATLVRTEGDTGAVLLGDVAEVALVGAPRRGTAADRGVSAVVLSIQKAPGTNTLGLTAAIDEALDNVKLPAGVTLNRHAFRQADFIERAVTNVSHVARDAAIIVAVILWLFLVNLRTTLITLAALPLSLGVAILVLDAFGLSLNVMTMGGLAVAIGELVDDAIIDVENVHRRLVENAGLPLAERRSTARVVYEASNEIRSSVVFATIIITAVFVPLLFLEGLEGRFFAPLGVAYISAILASLLVALTVTPAMCKLLLGHIGAPKEGEQGAEPGAKPDKHGSWLVDNLLAMYRPTLRWALSRRKLVLGATAVVTAATIVLASTFGSSFLPEFNEGSLTIFLTAPPGTALEESDRLARGIERRIADVEGVRSAVRRTGRAEKDEHAEPVWSSEIEVALNPGVTKPEVSKRIDAIIADVMGVRATIGQPIEHRLSHILSGTPAAIAIDLYDNDLAKLRRMAKAAEQALKATPGTRDVTANREQQVTTLPIRYRADDLARHGLTPAAAARQVAGAFSGKKVATVRTGTHAYDLLVRLHPDERRGHLDVEDFILRGGDGQLVRLRDVASVYPDRASVVVARSNARRKAVVSCNVEEDYNLGDVVAAVRKAIDPIAREQGVDVHYGGQFEAEQAARSRLLGLGGIALLVVLLLLNASLGSMRAALLVLLNLPLSLIGGIIAVYVFGSPDLIDNTVALFGGGEGRYVAPVMSVATLIGFVTLFGIAVRNGILLVNHYGHLQEREGANVREAVLRGSEERLVPILMTALTAVLGLLPLALTAGEPGSELLAPLAIVVLGGLLTSTLLNSIVVPVGYLIVFSRNPFERRTRSRLEVAPTAG